MKRPLLTLALLGAAAHAFAAPVIATGQIGFEGDSTLHRYQAAAQRFEVSFTFAGPTPASAAALAQAIQDHQVVRVQVDVPLANLTSGEGGLDDNMRKALKAEAHPSLRYGVASYDVTPQPGGALSLVMHGTLSLGGVDKPVDVRATVEAGPRGLHLVGSVPLKMTDFGIQPPVLMLGAIKCKDDVRVNLDLQLAPTR